MIPGPMNAVSILATSLRSHTVRSGAVVGALSVLLLLALTRATVGPSPGAGTTPSPQPTASQAPSAIAAVPTGAPDPAATPVRTPPPPNLTVPGQNRQSAVLAPRPGSEFYHGDPTRKEIYITIDDCQNWDRVDQDLEVAHDKGVQLTFFPAGRYIDNDEAAAEKGLRKMVAYGDEIDNHTYGHTFVADNATESFFQGDLASQLAVVRNALKDPTYREWFLRTPYGSGMDNSNLVTAAAREGLAVVKWSIDTKGYQAGSTLQSILYQVFDRPFFKPGAIILMHDDYNDTQALPLIIDGIRARGYEVGGPLKNILIDAPASSAMGSGRGLAAVPDPEAATPFADIVMGREDRAFAD
jgi:peptidoglycan/xylan/chitin deacetylase (PgdA/CDA1 family)